MPLMGSQVEQGILHDDRKKHAIAKLEDDKGMIVDGDHHREEDAYNINMPSSSSASSSLVDSSASNTSTSSSDLVDDASSTTSSNSSSANSNGPLFELSELIAELPIKRGLSKFYQGKSQSFTSLSNVRSIEDLAKKESPYRKRIKTCRSYGGGLDTHKSYALDPKATISKRVSRSSFSSLSFSASRRGSFLGSSRPPPVPVQKNF